MIKAKSDMQRWRQMRKIFMSVVATVGVSFGHPVASLAQSSSATGFWQQANFLGGMAGLRPALTGHGITFNLTDTEDLLSNIAGGVKQGATLQGLATADVQIDTGKAFGLPGGTFNISALQIHGRSLSPYYLDNLQTASGIEAPDSTRLWELWYDQSFAGGSIDVKLGQQSIDQEFIISKYSSLFINTMAGWPLLPSVDLYDGGPVYPLSSLGARLQAKPTGNVVFLAGVFDDNPPGGRFANDSISKDSGGLKFNLNTGALFISEMQITVNPFYGLPGTYKLGFLYDTGDFADQAFDNNGISLAATPTNGNAVIYHGNDNLYLVADQTIWQPKGSNQSVNLFVRAMTAPADQNLADLFINGGLTLTAPLPGRDNDSAGIDIGYGRISGRAAALDRAVNAVSGTHNPVRSAETLIELTYQAQVTPWLQIQPDAQYVLNPGGGILNPSGNGKLLQNEFVAGVRANIVF
jgi:porin